MKKLVVSFLLCFILILTGLPCFAMNTGFDLSDKSEEEIAAIVSRLDIELIDEPEIKTGFSCFDVNEFGDYALGFDRSEKDILLTYNAEGEYLYGFSFADNGGFGIEWDGNDIIVYSVRSDLAILIDKQGRCLDIKEIQNTSQNNEYWRKEVNANIRTVNGATFTAEHGLVNSELLHWGTYLCLVKTTPSGERMILFDVTANAIALTIIILFVVVILFTVVILVVCRVKHNPKARDA